MKNLRWSCLLLALVVLAADAVPASAQYSRRHRRAHREYREPRPSFALGGSIAAWEPSEVGDPAALLTGHFRVLLSRNWIIEPEINYWRHTSGFILDEQGFEHRVSERDVAVGGNLVYLSPIGYRTALYLGGGVAMHNWKLRGLTEYTDSAPGGQALVGLENRVGGTATIFVEGRYIFGEIDDFDRSGNSFDFSGGSIGAGLNFYF